MIVYESSFLNIELKGSILIHYWTNKTLTADAFQQELKVANTIFLKTKPTSTLWIQDNFDLIIPEELYDWIDDNVLKFQYRQGLRKLAFTIPQDQAILLSLTDIFNSVSQAVQPIYFVDERAALDVIKRTEIQPCKTKKLMLNVSHDALNLNFDVEPENLQFTMNYLNNIQSVQVFRLKNEAKFKLLTWREMEVFNLIISGLKSDEIANKLFISKNTVAGHRKLIIKKLSIHNLSDWINYANAFGMQNPL